MSLLYIFIYLCSRQFVSYLSFLSPSFVVLINCPLERLYFFSRKNIVKQFSVVILLNMTGKATVRAN